MKEKMTQDDLDNLADIIWWIKGFLAGCDADSNLCPFGAYHIESLRLAKINLKEMIDNGNCR